MITSLIPSFNAGELSPLIHLRSDLEKYRSGCRTLENFLIIPFGGVQRRAGFQYIETATTKCRLFRFQVSTALGFILEFGEEYIRFYVVDEPVATISTPYSVDDLSELQAVQVNNVAYFTHPRYPVHKLIRFSDTSWTFEPVDFSYAPMMDENLRKEERLNPATEGEIGDTIIVNASLNTFTEQSVGAYYEISHARKPGQFAVKLKATDPPGDTISDTLLVQGAWTFTTAGTWDGIFILERSEDVGASWQAIRRFGSAEDANYSTGGEEPELVRMRIRWEPQGNGSNNPFAKLEASGSYLRGLVKVTQFLSEKKVEALVIRPVQDGGTSYWREGAFSERRGYPRTAAAHEQRIVFGGTDYQPQTVWASVVDDYENFQPGGTDDDDSWTHVFASDQQNSIQWMISQKSLLIGTSGDEWVMAASKEESIITPTNVRARRHSGNGSAFLKSRLIDDSVVFVQRGGKRVRDMNYSFQNDGYATTDLTLLAEHIANQGVIDTAYQRLPESRLWCVTGGGEIIVLLYDRGQSISGWQRITTGKTGDGFESVAIKATDGANDQIWVSVRRTIDGTVRRYIERMNDDGTFLEAPWSELYFDTSGREIWSHGYVDYALYDVASEPGWTPGSAFYLCISPYNTADAIAPPSVNVVNWDVVYTFDYSVVIYPDPVGHYFYSGGTVYRNTQSWYSATIGTYEPGTGSDWESYWEVVVGYDTPPLFTVANDYETGDLVSYEGKPYIALSDHSAYAIDPTNATYWDLQQGQYTEGDLVSVDGVNYRCTDTHTPELSLKPGSVGGAWVDYWEIYTTTGNRFFVDSGVLLNDAGELSELDGLDHLEGETVQILANGYTIPSRVVSGGKILFNQESDPTEFSSLSVGLKYESVLEPMALEVGMQNGTSVSREKRIHEIVIWFHESGACKVASRRSGAFETIPFRDADFSGDQAMPLFTGPITRILNSQYSLDASFLIKQDLPMPLTVLAVVPKWNIYGDQG